jgi:hypothetical protein
MHHVVVRLDDCPLSGIKQQKGSILQKTLPLGFAKLGKFFGRYGLFSL